MGKSIIAQRRDRKAVCSKCQSPDYKMTSNELIGGKPNFTCGSCGHTWQYGYDGGVYAELAGEKFDTSEAHIVYGYDYAEVGGYTSMVSFRSSHELYTDGDSIYCRHCGISGNLNEIDKKLKNTPCLWRPKNT